MRSSFSLISSHPQKTASLDEAHATITSSASPLTHDTVGMPHRPDAHLPASALHAVASMAPIARQAPTPGVISEPLEGDGQFIARSPAMQGIFERSRQLAQFDV